MPTVDALVINEKDSVATALRSIQTGEKIQLKVSDKNYQIVILTDIPVFHKLSLHEIGQGEKIYKYGEVIGEAVSPIQAGEHVHSHNTVTLRG